MFPKQEEKSRLTRSREVGWIGSRFGCPCFKEFHFLQALQTLIFPRIQGILDGMGKHSGLIQKILTGKADRNIRFADLAALLVHLGFHERIKGSHHIFTKDGIAERINLQADGSNARAYQVKQVRNLLTNHQELQQ